MRVIAWDTETELMRPGCMAPPLTCLTWMEDKKPAEIEHWSKSESLLKSWLVDPEVLLVGMNVAYDCGVICSEFPALVPHVFKAYEDGRITDIMIRQQLIDIAHGVYRGYADPDGVWHKIGYSLFDLARRHTGVILKKDGWRLRYGEFRDIPLDKWEEHAAKLIEQAGEAVAAGSQDKDLQSITLDSPRQVLEYPLDDARYTMAVFEAQVKDEDIMEDQFRQARASWALHLSSAWGLRTQLSGVETLRAQTEKALFDVKERLVTAGFVRPNGVRDTKTVAVHMVKVCATGELLVRKTPAGGVCLDSDACEATEDPLLLDYAEFSTLNKTLTADIPMLVRGTTYPIHCRYNLAESGRTTCSNPNIQNLRKLPGIRECFVPRPGKVFIQADFPQLELYTLAQCCYTWFGHSALGESLKAGMDPHTAFAAILAGVSYEEGLKLRESGDKRFDDLRQIGKAFNFGKPGGLGPNKLIALAAKAPYNVTMTETEAKQYGKIWLDTLPEMKEYFARVNSLIGADDLATVQIPGTGLIRGGAKYCAACNTGFQGLGAACAKNAMWLVAKAQYSESESPLHGSRTVAFIHDELIAECDEDKAHTAAFELARVMVEGANALLPDVPINVKKVKPTAMRWWSKEASPIFLDGKLIPWEGQA